MTQREDNQSKESVVILDTEYYSGTCAYNIKNIEGYMLKEIESKKMFHEDVFHLRFFRVVQNSGKLAIKMEKTDKKMRTLNLDELVAVN